jgi:hypothetical protein
MNSYYELAWIGEKPSWPRLRYKRGILFEGLRQTTTEPQSSRAGFEVGAYPMRKGSSNHLEAR